MVYTYESELLDLVRAAQAAGQTVVLATGVFDLLHEEHVRFLKKARAVGDILIVGVECDLRVKQLKGPDRPIHSQKTRIAALRQLGFIDFVFILPENFAEKAEQEHLIETVRPDILAVSSHTGHLDKKRQVLEKYGGKVMIVHEHNPAISTTILLSQYATMNPMKE